MARDADTSGPGIYVPGAPDFQPLIPELLATAKIKHTSVARHKLDNHLKMAWIECAMTRKNRENPAPPKLIEQLTKSITKTSQLLRRLSKQSRWRDIGFDICSVDDETVTTMTVSELISGGTLDLPRNPPPLAPTIDDYRGADTLVAINRQRMLDRLLRDLSRLKPHKKRGGQEQKEITSLIQRAHIFFREHSPSEPTQHFDGPFVKFCRYFYKAVLGKDPSSSGLEKPIRKILRVERTRDLNVQ
jgi:hypothetical protein